MTSPNLSALDSAVRHLLGQPSFAATLADLERELANSTATFVWATVDLDSIPAELPGEIESGWIFHLRRDVPSGAHYHPNSIQHMTLVAGGGEAVLGGERSAMVPFDAPAPVEERWIVIGEGVPHEFVPTGGDMTVVSFHTCGAEELEEVECDSGHLRHYEGPEA